jgi:hypothetical protein
MDDMPVFELLAISLAISLLINLMFMRNVIQIRKSIGELIDELQKPDEWDDDVDGDPLDPNRSCVYCGCTNARACKMPDEEGGGPCWWVDENVCSNPECRGKWLRGDIGLFPVRLDEQ